MDVSDIVSMLDQKYGGDNAVPCPNEGQPVKMSCKFITNQHGHLGVHKSGSALVCGVCGYTQPVGVS